MRNGLPHYDLHHAIFGSTLATGKYAAPSTDPYVSRGLGDDDEEPSSDDMETTHMESGPRSGDKRGGSSRMGRRNQKKGKAKAGYEASIEEMCGVYVANHKRDMTSQQSRQTGPVTVEMAKIIEGVTALPDVDYDTMVGAIEFFRVHPDARQVFLDLPQYLQSSYVRRVGV